MAKKKKNGAAGGVSKQQKRQAEERASTKEREEMEKRAENARKSRQMGNVFLYAILSLVAVFCLYTLIRTLFFPAASVSELRSNFLFISLVAIPYLIATVAVVTRKLTKKRRAGYTDQGRRRSGLIFALILVFAAFTFGYQMLQGRKDAAGEPIYTRTVEALEGSGMTVSKPEEVYGFESLLEYSLETELTCGQTKVLLNDHRAYTGGLANRFESQVRQDYAAFAALESPEWPKEVTVWPPVTGSEDPRAAIAYRKDSRIIILELKGPESEIDALLPVLANAVLP